MYSESDNKKQTEKQDRYREQIGGCQWQVVERISEMCEGSQKYKLPVIKEINSEDVMYSMVTTVNNNILYIQKSLRE